jgi:hypothetical protein
MGSILLNFLLSGRIILGYKSIPDRIEEIG